MGEGYEIGPVGNLFRINYLLSTYNIDLNGSVNTNSIYLLTF